MAQCPECAFPLRSLDVHGPRAGTPFAWHYDEGGWAQAADQITTATNAVATILRSTKPESLRSRVDPTVWSPLEYACHIRDVLLVQRERVLKVRRGHGRETQPMGRDERVEHDGYNEQHTDDVAVQVEQAAILFIGVLARLGSAEWDLQIDYNFPEDITRNLRWVAVHTAHEVVHHLQDMRSQA
jgi:hypothetical protein